jgi:hypothetical protein
MFVVIFFATTMCPQDADAYIDPGTGSYFFQILVASAIGALFVLRNSLRQLWSLLKKWIIRG